ncbi:hypothetical protein ACFE04_001122 [Oxalis oulophora]
MKESIVETREEFMVSPTGSNPTKRKAHFLKPSIIKEHVFDFDHLLPPHSLTSFPSNFKPNLKLNFNAWTFPQEKWITWVQKMSSLHGSTWKKVGIFHPIINSTYKIEKNTDLLLGFTEKWCPNTKSFIFPWGEATITLEDVMICLGYSVLGCPVTISVQNKELRKIEEQLNRATSEFRKTTAAKAYHHQWMMSFMDSGSEIEHEAFLVLWLSRYVFAELSRVIVPSVVSVAVNLASGTRIALAPAVLASVYRDLSLLKSALIDVVNGGGGDAALRVNVASQFQLVQIWAWERFIDLQPNANVIRNDEPRLARWNKNKEIMQQQKGSTMKFSRKQKTSSMKKILEKRKRTGKFKKLLASTSKNFKLTPKRLRGTKKSSERSKATFSVEIMHKKLLVFTKKRSIAKRKTRSDDDDDCNMTILELVKSTKKRGTAKPRMVSDNSSFQILHSPIVDSEVLRNVESETGLVDRKSTMVGLDTALEGKSFDEGDYMTVLEAVKSKHIGTEIGQSSGKEALGQNEDGRKGAGSSYSFEIPGQKLELEIIQLERIFRRVKKAVLAKNVSHR